MERRGKKANKNLHIVLPINEGNMLEEFCPNYGAKTLLIRTLLRRFFSEQGMLTKVEGAKLCQNELKPADQ